MKMHEEDSVNSRTLFCGNLSENVTEALLYELFLQAGPLDRVSLPKKDGRQCSFAFITFSHGCSIPYAVELFGGTRLFNRDLRLQLRDGPGNNRTPQPTYQHSQSHYQSNESLNRSASRSHNNSFESPVAGNPFSNSSSSALRMGFQGGPANNADMRPTNVQRKPDVLHQQLSNINQLLQMGSQMMSSANSSTDTTRNSGSGRYSNEHDDRGHHQPYDNNTARPYRRSGQSHRRETEPYDNERRPHNDRDYSKSNDRGHHNRDRSNRSSGGGGGGSGRNRY